MYSVNSKLCKTQQEHPIVEEHNLGGFLAHNLILAAVLELIFEMCKKMERKEIQLFASKN